MDKIHSHVAHLLSFLGKDKLADVIFTGSQISPNVSTTSDYDFVVVLNNNHDISEMIELCKNLSLYSKYPLDLIVTSLDLINKTNPLVSYSSLLNYLRIPGLAVSKLPLPPFDPFLYKASQIKVLTKIMASSGFKSIRHIKKTLSFFQISLTDAASVQGRVIKCDYERDFKHLSFVDELVKNKFAITRELKNLIVTELENQLQLLNADSESWQKYELLNFGMDEVFLKAAQEFTSVKDIYYQSIFALLRHAKNEVP